MIDLFLLIIHRKGGEKSPRESKDYSSSKGKKSKLSEKQKLAVWQELYQKQN